MAYASRAGRARVSTRNQQAFAVCDRCGIWNNHVNLLWQYDWAGAKLNNLRILVCDRCEDIPQQQKRAIVLTADPLPVLNARVEAYAADETNYHTTVVPPVIDPITGLNVAQGQYLLTQDGQYMVEQPVGKPNGLESYAISPLNGSVHYGVVLPLLSVNTDGSNKVTVTCNGVHGLSTNDQISIDGLTNTNACGFYSVTVTTATAFTYLTAKTIPAASLLQSQTVAKTVIVGLPYDFNQIPLVG